MGTNYIWPGQVDSEESNRRRISGRYISLVHKCPHHLLNTMSSVCVTIPHLMWIGYSRWLCTAEGGERGAANHSALTTLGHCKALCKGSNLMHSWWSQYHISEGLCEIWVGRAGRQCSVVVEVCNLSPQWGILILPVMYLDFVLFLLFPWAHLLLGLISSTQ